MKIINIENSSFRDPSGFLFYRNGILHRQINISYKENFELLINSKLYENLVNSDLLISHTETEIEPFDGKKYYKIITPELIPFISYPYEWSFSQLKNAALTTLEIQKRALEHGMTLKDGSAYNIQFRKGKPIFIDTLSFEKYNIGEPWKPYRQFCQHFLAPLALMSKKDIRLNQLLRIYLDGIPLDLTAKLLPLKTFTSFSLLSHIYAHAKTQKHFEGKKRDVKNVKLSKKSLMGLIESLNSGIKKINLPNEKTEWGDYYLKTNYTEVSFQEKKRIVSELIEEINPKTVWDLGANTGAFSRIASEKGIRTISFDIDPIAVEKNYLQVVKNNETEILPLQIDLTNPSPNIGWSNKERSSFIERGPTDVVLALALIHHLAISNNLPFYRIVKFFSEITNYLIIEFIPKTDSQVQKLLFTRVDIFDEYTKESFELHFEKYFKLIKSISLKDSQRILYLFKRKN